MTNKELFYFTGKCLMLDEDPEFRHEIYKTIAANDIEWQRFVALCSNHLVLPVIYLKFKKHGILEYVPEELAEYLMEIYELNLARNRQILIQLQEITTILNKSNIYPIFLKGAAHLLDELYSDIGERIMGDIDFLVPEKDYIPAARLLETDGYSLFPGSPVYFDIETSKHYPPISKPGSPAYLEIHRLLTEESLSWFNTGITDKEKIMVKALSGSYVLSDHHKIIHNFVHSQLHHDGHTSGIVSFRDLYDLYLLSNRSSLEQALPDIKCRQKAIAYFKLTGKAFGLDDNFCPGSNFTVWFFLKKHDLNIRSASFYQINRILVFIVNRVLVGHTSQIIKSFYSKKVRHSVIKRLTDRKWYRAHFRSYLDFFYRKSDKI